jgi:hypothetical protein
MGKSKQETTLVMKALKQIDIDRTRVETKNTAPNKASCSDTNPFELSDGEDTRPDSALLAHLVLDISEVCFDDVELDTKIYDLMTTSRKSKASRKKGYNTNKKIDIQMKGLYWNSRDLSDLAKYRYISDAVKEHNLDFIAMMETGKHDMSKTNLNRLSGGADLVWHCLPPKGWSGVFY